MFLVGAIFFAIHMLRLNGHLMIVEINKTKPMKKQPPCHRKNGYQPYWMYHGTGVGQPWPIRIMWRKT